MRIATSIPNSAPTALLFFVLLNSALPSISATGSSELKRQPFASMLSDLFDSTTSFDTVVRRQLDAMLASDRVKPKRYNFDRAFDTSRYKIEVALQAATNAAKRLQAGMHNASESYSYQHRLVVDCGYRDELMGHCQRPPPFVNAKLQDHNTQFLKTKAAALSTRAAEYNFFPVDFQRSAVHVPTDALISRIIPSSLTTQTLNNIALSNPLEEIMRQNYLDNVNIHFQYFTNSDDGSTRFFPAMRWPLGEPCPHGRSSLCTPDVYDGRKQRWYHKVTTGGGRNVLMMLDTSGSVWGGPLSVNRLFIRLILESLDADDFVQVMSFSKKPMYASCLTSMWRAKPLTKRILYESILQAKDTKKANYSRAIAFGIDLLRNGSAFEPEVSAKSCHQIAIVLSDGVTEFNVDFLRDMGVASKPQSKNSTKQRSKRSVTPLIRIFAIMAGLNPNPVSGLSKLVCNANGQLILGLRDYYVHRNYLTWTNHLSLALRGAATAELERAGIWSARHRHPFTGQDVVTVSFPVVNQLTSSWRNSTSNLIRTSTSSMTSEERGELGVVAIDVTVDFLRTLLPQCQWPGSQSVILNLHGSIITSQGNRFEKIAALQRSGGIGTDTEDIDDQNYIEVDWLDTGYANADNEAVRYKILVDGPMTRGSFTSPKPLATPSNGNSSYAVLGDYNFLYAPLDALGNGISNIPTASPYVLVWYYPQTFGWYLQAQQPHSKPMSFETEATTTNSRHREAIHATDWAQCNKTTLFSTENSGKRDFQCASHVADVQLIGSMLDVWFAQTLLPSPRSESQWSFGETVVGWFFIGASGVVGAHPPPLQTCFLNNATVRAVFEAATLLSSKEVQLIIKPFSFLLNTETIADMNTDVTACATVDGKVEFEWNQNKVEFIPSQIAVVIKPVTDNHNHVVGAVGVLMFTDTIRPLLLTSTEVEQVGGCGRDRHCFWLDDGGFIVTANGDENEAEHVPVENNAEEISVAAYNLPSMAGNFYGFYDYPVWNNFVADYKDSDSDYSKVMYWRFEQLRYDKNCPFKSKTRSDNASAVSSSGGSRYLLAGSLLKYRSLSIAAKFFQSFISIFTAIVFTFCQLLLCKVIPTSLAENPQQLLHGFYYNASTNEQLFVTSENRVRNQSDFVRKKPFDLPHIQLCATRQAQYTLINRPSDNKVFSTWTECDYCTRQAHMIRIHGTNTAFLSVESHCRPPSSSSCGFRGTPLFPWPQFVIDGADVCERIVSGHWPDKRPSSPHTYQQAGACPHRTKSNSEDNSEATNAFYGTSGDNNCRHYINHDEDEGSAKLRKDNNDFAASAATRQYVSFNTLPSVTFTSLIVLLLGKY